MRIFEGRRSAALCLLAAQLCLFFPQRGLCQTETFDIVHFTPPKDWAKNAIQGAITYSNSNKSTGGFCVLTFFSSSPSLGAPKEDFSVEWNEFVAKPYKAEANPTTQTQTTADGWSITAGGANVELNGIKFLVVLTVFSGFGKKVSVMANLNDQSYLAGIDALLQDITLDKPTSSKAQTKLTNIADQTIAASNDTTTGAAIKWFALLQDYQDNEIAADGRYKGKRIRVVGPFANAANEQGRIVVWFNTPASSFSHVGCYFSNSQSAVVAALKPGQVIVVEGICRGRVSVGRLMLEDCVLR